MQEELVFRPARELAKLVRSREVSPVEIAEAFLARIEKLNPQLNAFITVTADEAMRGASITALRAPRAARGRRSPPTSLRFRLGPIPAARSGRRPRHVASSD